MMLFRVGAATPCRARRLSRTEHLFFLYNVVGAFSPVVKWFVKKSTKRLHLREGCDRIVEIL